MTTYDGLVYPMAVPAFQYPRAVLTVDLCQIQKNLQAIRAEVGGLQVMAVLKANAYGLGIEPVAQALAAAGVDRIGVANVEEALSIVALGVPVQILGAILPEEVPVCIEHDVVIPVSDSRVLAEVSRVASGLGKCATVQILIDTGMGRLGALPSDAPSLMRSAATMAHVVLEGVYSHFPSAFEDVDFSRRQIELFKAIVNQAGVNVPLLHIANSDGINNVPAAYQAPFNMVRTGINLYGYFDVLGARGMAVKPVIELQAKLVSVRMLEAGMTIGYGRTYQVAGPARIGTVAIGYADGLPMQLCDGGRLKVRDAICPVVGRVSMDYTTILLDHVPDAQLGDDVLCLGSGLPLDDWVARKGTAPYEAICALGQRVARAYLS